MNGGAKLDGSGTHIHTHEGGGGLEKAGESELIMNQTISSHIQKQVKAQLKFMGADSSGDEQSPRNEVWLRHFIEQVECKGESTGKGIAPQQMVEGEKFQLEGKAMELGC